MSSLLTTIREFFGPPDPRSEREIEDDIDAEFAFHIEQTERELIEQGVPAEHAADLARARFGNQAKFKLRCKRIAMEDRAMLQRINTVLMIVVMLAVIGVSIQMYFTQRYNSLALQDITTRIANIQVVAQASTEAPHGAVDTMEGVGHVLVEGDVEQPGYYPVRLGETLRRDLLIEVGVEGGMGVQYFQRGSTRATPLDAERYFDGPAGRRLVTDGDRIFVTAAYGSQISDVRRSSPTTGLESGTWREVDEDGKLVPDGAVLELLAARDIRNVRNQTTGTLKIAGDAREITLSFSDTGRPLTSPQTVHVRLGGEGRLTGRWVIEGDVLHLNIAAALQDWDMPVLRFRMTSDLDRAGELPAAAERYPIRQVYLEGDVSRRGVFNLPPNVDMTARRLIIASNSDVSERAVIDVARTTDEGYRQYRLGTLADLTADPDKDMVLQSGDIVSIRVTDSGGAPTAAEPDDDAKARILIEGDIERPGWYPVMLDEATYVHGLLERAGVHERQWVRHRRPGDTRTRYELAEIYFGDDRPRTVIRPGDEIVVADEVSDEIRAEFAVRRAETYLYPYEWRQIDEHNEVVEDGWKIHFEPHQSRTPWLGSMMLIHSQRDTSYPIQLVSRPMGLTLIVSEESEESEQTRRIGLHCSFDVESMTLTITSWAGHDRINWTEEHLEELLVQIGLPRKFTVGRFPRE